MTASLPYFDSITKLPLVVSISCILALGILGGILNPVHRWVIYLDAFVSIIAFIGYEYYAVTAYLNLPMDIPINVYFYWVNQIFAILFFLAVYYSIKTLRGKLMVD